MSNFTKAILALTLLVAANALTSCNTVRGVGQDVSAAGNAVASGANAARH